MDFSALIEVTLHTVVNAGIIDGVACSQKMQQALDTIPMPFVP